MMTDLDFERDVKVKDPVCRVHLAVDLATVKIAHEGRAHFLLVCRSQALPGSAKVAMLEADSGLDSSSRYENIATIDATWRPFARISRAMLVTNLLRPHDRQPHLYLLGQGWSRCNAVGFAPS